MCGIVGVVSAKSTINEDQIKTATQSLTHRGPEGEGYYTNDKKTAAFGHRRLCVIDLSHEANQPMSFADRYTIVYNGELYNYIELRNNLKQKGIQFSTESDTEVIIASYATYGKECIKSFDGAFAFAIWDEQEHVLFAARDRFGEKPFFYSFSEDKLIFSSEVKALWKLGVKKEVNEKLLYNFLTIGYTSNPYLPAETFFEGISKLPAACSLIYSMSNNQLSIEKYWQVFIEMDNQITEQQAIEKFDSLFTASIKKRLRSDVAIGTSLSGGLDSSTIVAYCEKMVSNQYTHQCFTAAFKGFEKDESCYATIVAKQFNLKHTIVETGPQEIVALMERVMQHQDEPLESASALIQFKIYEAAKKNGVTVLLDGQGADEVLGGYHKYFKWYWQQLFRQNRSLYAQEKKSYHGNRYPSKVWCEGENCFSFTTPGFCNTTKQEKNGCCKFSRFE